MTKRKMQEQFFENLENDSASWLEEARYRKDNRDWLQKSRDIAILLQTYLRKKGMRQNQLAEQLSVSAQQVSKILKGKENLTLETISKLESVLGINLVEVSSFQEELEVPSSYQEEITATHSMKRFTSNKKISNLENQQWTSKSVNDDPSNYRITG